MRRDARAARDTVHAVDQLASHDAEIDRRDEAPRCVERARRGAVVVGPAVLRVVVAERLAVRRRRGGGGGAAPVRHLPRRHRYVARAARRALLLRVPPRARRRVHLAERVTVREWHRLEEEVGALDGEQHLKHLRAAHLGSEQKDI